MLRARCGGAAAAPGAAGAARAPRAAWAPLPPLSLAPRGAAAAAWRAAARPHWSAGLLCRAQRPQQEEEQRPKLWQPPAWGRGDRKPGVGGGSGDGGRKGEVR
jgi:hypothetical protein